LFGRGAGWKLSQAKVRLRGFKDFELGSWFESRGGVLPAVGYTGRLCPKELACYKLTVLMLKGRENCNFSIRKDHKINCKVEKMAAKVKMSKGATFWKK